MNAKIWLVDGDLSMRESLGFLLSTMEYHVANFADVAAFEAAAQTAKAVRGCLLMDADTADARGFSGWKEHRQRYPFLVVIIMTGHNGVEVCQRDSYPGALAFFTKPLEMQPLLKSLQQAMRESEQRWQLQQTC